MAFLAVIENPAALPDSLKKSARPKSLVNVKKKFDKE